jgi:hypothetical protein
MDTTLTTFLAATVTIGAAILFVILFRHYLAVNSERRMQAMLENVGVDPEVASLSSVDNIMFEVRKRCKNCKSESLCERWLAGEETGGNEFCPNAKVFEILKQH